MRRNGEKDDEGVNEVKEGEGKEVDKEGGCVRLDALRRERRGEGDECGRGQGGEDEDRGRWRVIWIQ